jgi:formate dehydrogenase major subunit
VENDEPVIEDITREFNRGMWTIGYTGQSPERLKLHMANQHTFDKTTLRAEAARRRRLLRHAVALLGHAEMKHPGTPNLYDTSKPVAEGGLCFRARFGVERDGDNLLAEGSYPVGSEIEDGYPEFTMQMLKDLGWDGDLTARRTAAIEKPAGRDKDQLEDRPLGRHPARRDQAWLRALRQRQGPQRGLDLPGSGADPPRAALHQPPRSGGRLSDLRGPQVLPSADPVCVDPEERLLQGLSDHPHLRRLVEYEGGGDETRSNPWLAELQQDMFVEINPRDANNLGIGTARRSGSRRRKAARSRSWRW